MAAGLSKYAVVRDQLAKRVADMKPGDQLPTESELCDEFGVSRITVRRAVDELAGDGLVVREQGRGTFVANPVITNSIRETFQNDVAGFHREQTAQGNRVTTRVLCNHVITDSSAAAALGLSPNDELIELERLRYVNGILHQHVRTYLPASRYPAVLSQDFSEGSLFAFLESRYGVQLKRNDLLVRVVATDEDLSGLLNVPVGTPLLAIDSSVFDGSQTPVAFGTASHTPDQSSIAISLRSDNLSDTRFPA